MPLIDHQVCQNTQTGKLYQMVSGRPYPDIQICAGFLNGTKDACQVKYRINGNKAYLNYLIEYLGILVYNIFDCN